MRVALSVPAGNQRGPLYFEQALAAIFQSNAARLPITFAIDRHEGQAVLTCEYPPALRAVVEGQLYAQFPDCRLDPLPDSPALPAEHTGWQAHLELRRELFPTRRYPQFEDVTNRTSADPLTAILTTVARQKKKGLSARIAITLRPARNKRRVRAERCMGRLMRPFFQYHHGLAHLYIDLALSHSRVRRFFGWMLGRLARSTEHGRETVNLDSSSNRSHDREADLAAAADKLGRLLLEAEIRLTVSGPPGSEQAAAEKLVEMAGAFGQFNTHRLASFHLSRPRFLRDRPRHGHSVLLSVEEAATIVHPPTQTVRAETMKTVQSRAFEPPTALPTPASHPDLAVLGVTAFRTKRQHFGIMPDDRRRHIAILGKTGMGKSTLLHHLITSDIAAGRGVCLVDPHGDLVNAVLPAIPARRSNDVVLFDAGDAEHPLSFNLLACDDRAQRPLLASGILSAFRKLYGPFWGPRLEHILRNALLALLEVPGATLLSVLRLLSDGKYRQTIVGRLTDPVVRSFWQQEFASMPPKLQLEAIAPIQNKIGHFVSSPLLRNIIGQSRSSLDLRRTMDEGKILLVNLSKGRVGDDASGLLGSFLVTALQLAAMSRADIPEADRRDFFLYVDEFQNYATDSFATILSEARKYRLNLTVANQYLAQLDEATRDAVFGNIGSLVSFAVGAQDSEVVAQELGGDLQPQDVMTLPRYAAYVKLLVEGVPSRPFSMQTLAPDTRPSDPRRPEAIRRYSRQRYARPVAHVERDIAAALAV